MQKIKSWMSANKFKFNGDKTELIAFRKKKSATIDDITINNNVIQRLKSITITINNNVIQGLKSVGNLGFYLDEFFGHAISHF